MGNRSSTHYPPPPQWMHPPPGGQRGCYPSPYPEQKRPIGPGAFAEPYIPHQNVRRSMISLNADSGYLTSPSGDSDRMRMRGSRMSLNHVEFDHLPPMQPHILIPHDAKTLKKLEKMEKKQQKLWKKLGRMPVPPPMHLPPPPPMYTRAMSFDDLNRMHDVEVDTRPYRREWRTPGEVRAPIGLREHSLHSDKPKYSRPIMRNTRDLGSSLASSSPMTSSEEGQPTDHWGANSSLSSSRGTEPPKRNTMSPPMYTSTPHQGSPKLKSVGKTIEVKVERSEKVERTTEKTERNPQNQTYAQPILRNQPGYGSRSSVATSQMRCDQSEIDFSWVSEEEDKLRHEQRHQGERRLPECYFGMDPPSMEEKNEKENEKRRRLSVLEKTAALEQEVRRREANFLTRSTTQLGEPQPDYSPMHARESNPRDSGPSERRIYRIQRQSEGGRDEKRQRSSMAF